MDPALAPDTRTTAPGCRPVIFLNSVYSDDLLCEGHLPIANHEQPDREQQEAAQHKHADARHSRRCRH